MTTPKKATEKPAVKQPQDHKKPSEVVDDELEQAELRRELLADMPALRPPHRFRLRHRNAFNNLVLDATKSGAFDRDDLEYDLTTPDDIEAFQKLQNFVASIDEWAEGIADDPQKYAEWSEGKDEETFMALFVEYREALGKLSGSES